MNSPFTFNIYVYSIVDKDGNHHYSAPFTAINDTSAIRLLADTVATYRFHDEVKLDVSHLYRLGFVDYQCTVTSDPSVTNFELCSNSYEVPINDSDFVKLVTEFTDSLEKLRAEAEDICNA